MALRTLAWMVLSGVVVIAVLLVGRHVSGGDDSVTATGEEVEEVSSRAAGPATGKERAASSLRQLPTVALSVPLVERMDDEDPALTQSRGSRAEYLLGQVFKQLETYSSAGLEPAEARTNTVLPYLRGLIQGAIQADPRMRSAFSAQFTSALCDRPLAEDQSIVVAQMAILLPDVATPRGFDCFFSKAKEGVPLWTMLDAWRRSGLATTPPLEKLQASSTDPRTTRRFLSKEEVMAQRPSKSILGTSPVP